MLRGIVNARVACLRALRGDPDLPIEREIHAHSERRCGRSSHSSRSNITGQGRGSQSTRRERPAF